MKIIAWSIRSIVVAGLVLSACSDGDPSHPPTGGSGGSSGAGGSGGTGAVGGDGGMTDGGPSDLAGCPACTVLADKRQAAFALAIDGTHVYWAETPASGGVIRKIPQGGGEIFELTQESNNPIALAVNNVGAYWISSVNTFDGTISKVALTGGTASVIAGRQLEPAAIAVDATHVYWSNWKGGQIMRLGADGRGPLELATKRMYPNGVALDANNVYWAETGDYMQPEPAGAIMTVPKTGEESRVVVGGQAAPMELVVDGGNVYWLDYGRDPLNGPTVLGAVMKASLDDGLAVALVENVSRPRNIAIDAGFVYYTTPETGNRSHDATISKVLRRGGEPTVVAGGLPNVGAIAVDDSAVYFTIHTTVVKTPK